MQRRVASVLGAVALGAAFLGGYLISTRGEAGWLAAAGAPVTAPQAATPAERLGTGERRPTVVVLPAVLPAHSAWAQLTALTAEVEREQRAVALEQARVAETARRLGSESGSRETTTQIAEAHQGGRAETRTALETAYERRQQTELARIKAEAERKVAERRAILDAKVDEEVGVKRGQLKASLATKVEEIRRSREAKLLSLQLRLGLAPKDGEGASEEPLKEELQQAQAEIDREVGAAQAESERQLKEYADQTAAAAQRELTGFASQVTAEAERQAAATTEQLRAELAQKLAALDSATADAAPANPAGAGAVGKSPVAAAPSATLLARRSALQASIVDDVRRLATRLAQERGLAAPKLVSDAADRPAGAVDLTGAVASALQQQR